ncbi:MAG: pyruvate kinase [Gammaproteobacteria bacterium]|nr:pyruvate kinase [Gammaproteobacteria bacterium]
MRKFAMDLGVDYLALSFVRRHEDIEDLRELIRTSDHDTPIIAKIEKPEALQDMSNILAATDAVMIARGDLGVELSPEQVPVAQKQIIEMARRHYKPVIVATQMLESMIENARPTRAEVADVANAVSLGADAVMLSGETAVGAFPAEAVRMMDRVVRNTETYIWREGGLTPLKRPAERKIWPIWDAMASASLGTGQRPAGARHLRHQPVRHVGGNHQLGPAVGTGTGHHRQGESQQKTGTDVGRDSHTLERRRSRKPEYPGKGHRQSAGTRKQRRLHSAGQGIPQ